MTTEFSFPRIGLILKSEIARNYKIYLTLLLVQAGIFLLGALFGGVNGMIGANSLITTGNACIIVLMPFILYSHLFHTVKGVNTTMLPASQNEKFAVSLFQCIVLTPFVLLFFHWLLSTIGMLLTGVNEVMTQPWELFVSRKLHVNHGLNMGFFDSYFWEVISSQTVCIWGVYFFKTKKFWKTVLTICCVSIALGIVGGIGLNVAFDAYEGGMYTFFADAATRFARIMYVFFNLIVPVGLWVWAFCKYRKQQF